MNDRPFFDTNVLVYKCSTLYSEDLQGDHIIDGTLTIRNPFIAP